MTPPDNEHRTPPMPPLSPMSLNPRNWSVRARLMAWNIGLVAVVVGTLGALALVGIRAALLGAVDRGLSDRARHFHAPPRPPRMGAAADAGPEPFQPFAPPGPPPGFEPPHRPVTNDPYRPRELDLDGRATVPGSPDARQGPWDRAAFERAAAGTEEFSTITYDDEPVRIVSEPVRRGGRVVGVTQMAQPLGETLRAIAGVRQTLLALIPAALLLAGLGGAAVTGRALRPVRDITEAADRIGAHDLSERLPVRGSDEFSRLADTFNGMLARLGGAFDEQRALLEQQKRFTADASHELKTPLAVAKVHADLLLQPGATSGEARESAQDIRRALDRMGRLVGDLLVLARHDAGTWGQLRGATDVMVRDVLEQARCDVLARAGDRPPVRVLVPDACMTVHGSEPDLVRLFSNLLDNALRHTPPEGEVRAAAHEENEAVVVTVSDTGIGIAPEHLPHLGERFYRVDAARARPDSSGPEAGSGLGLAICRGIVEAHGGAIRFESAVGRGTTVTVTLPRHPTDGPRYCRAAQSF